MVQSFSIFSIFIKNFKNISREVTLSNIQKCNSLIGLSETLKKDVIFAIIYAMGGTANQIQIADIVDVSCVQSDVCSVQLYVKNANGEMKRFSRAMYRHEESFSVDDELMQIAEYKHHLRNVNIDLDKQLYFFEARNRTFFWNSLTSMQDELIARLTDMPSHITAYHDYRNQYGQLDFAVTMKETKIRENQQIIKALQQKLPRHEEDWNEEFMRQIKSSLKIDEIERRAKKQELYNYREKMREIATRDDALRQQILAEEATVNQKYQETDLLLSELQRHENEPYRDQSIESLKFKAQSLKDKVDFTEMRISDGELLLPDLQDAYYSIFNSRVRALQSASDAPQTARHFTEDAFLKMHKIYHAVDELNLDKLKMDLTEKEAKLNEIDNRKKDLEYFDTFFPNRRLKSTSTIENCANTLANLNSAIKRMYDPNIMLFSEYEHFFEIIQKLIPEKKGFMLTSAFPAIEEQHKCMIESVLRHYKYTIVLYKDDKKEISDMLKKKHSALHQMVSFVVISTLPTAARIFSLQPNHWMNYCRPTTNEQKLIQFMAKQKNIFRVETHEEVRNEHRLITRKYVVSADGQLIYMRSMNVLDVLEYLKPGKKPEQLQFNDAAQKLLEANKKCGEMIASLFETEIIPRNENIDTGDELRQEVRDLKKKFEEQKSRQNVRMEELRLTMDATYTVPNSQIIDSIRHMDRDRLFIITERITKIETEAVTHRESISKLAGEVNIIERCIETKKLIESNESDKVVHRKKLEEFQRSAKPVQKIKEKIQEKITKLENDLRGLKYSTMTTANYALRNVNVLNDNVLSNSNIFRSIQQNVFIEAEAIELDIENMDPNEPLKDCARRIYYLDITEAKREITALQSEIENMKIQMNEITASELREHTYLVIHCTEFNRAINNNLRIIERLLPQFRYSIKFNFNFEKDIDFKDMIVVIENNQAVQIEDLAINDQKTVHWIVFAAFLQYSNAQFVFIDFRDDSNISTDVVDIVKWIASKCQIFCNSHHTQLCTVCTFVDVQIAVNRTEANEEQFFLWHKNQEN